MFLCRELLSRGGGASGNMTKIYAMDRKRPLISNLLLQRNIVLSFHEIATLFEF